MDELKSLANDWKNIKESAEEKSGAEESLIQKLIKIQRRFIFQNLMMSIAFAVTFVVLALIRINISNQSPQFYHSIDAMFILLILTLALFWYKILFWRRPDYSADVRTFSNTVLKKLRFSLWLNRVYMPVYLVLLAFILTFYLMEALKDASLVFTLTAYGLTYGWLFGMGGYMQRKRKRKLQKELQPLIDQLKAVASELAFEEENLE